MTKFQQFCIDCVVCGAGTSRKFAREHDGKCKSCVTGVYSGPKCSQCDGPISAYKAKHHYVCDGCYAENDPIGYSNEVRGMYDGPDC